MGLPNYITFSRLFITPIFMILYLKGKWFGITPVVLPYVLLILLAISELTDAIDGYVARKFSQVTDLGKLLDPMADSIYRISLYLTFTQPPVNLPLLLVFIFLARDSVISTLRTVCAFRGCVVAARASGKLKAILQGLSFFLILLAMIPHSLGIISDNGLELFASVMVSIIAVYSIASGIEYFWMNKNFLAQKSKIKDVEKNHESND
ncbi:CDP-diacylglycerol--glycerol-3-phosphate 3-phosphatidyltransferase,phosphatidylglycerophosphate synthetase,CDP-diacylglycerol--glycerol-3-phosphate 3-phosphatidyltransferase,CDP-alcohol phosphatidyltransferase [Chlamydia serpentis]|uniref:CDP-diacylglycerol--glycerol-3-phosphate 3-phosphatidyltransferase n=1 Tax=Chlamydia serpentis TaxID=1967782 RepID=A0A2R8FCA4_9CHLA|nr:CDP-diacylglycerol--glycerol-3-phosphate 3-phosphatidyltransferase [Chlamydia serpentis]SPN74055.1 CDP-diacylglycerol--glycerol-3-phosphate 3-phosphatidyltransferase,phosphatidylglycerophosphate synthetase,CDP-diacylglycerol--glycerol-3-phosphate 3-phosphatidyltransferase,CDP-alcohol phosphatidyltransferase [Chlamydia serpentis]